MPNTGFTINGTDLDGTLIPRSALLDRFPELSSVFTEWGLWAWGDNGYSQLGNGNTTATSSPVQATTVGPGWRQISTIDKGFVGVRQDGTLWAWGSSIGGASGTGSSPSQVGSSTNWLAIKGVTLSTGGVSRNGVIALKTDATAWVWGWNYSFTLGTGSAFVGPLNSPVQLGAGGPGWKNVVLAPGEGGGGGIKVDGTLWMWGAGRGGFIGDNTIVTKSTPVQTIAGGTNWKQIMVHAGAGASTFCAVEAIKTDGTLWVWGNNYRTITGAGGSFSSPVQITGGGTNWKTLGTTPGYTQHSGAIKTDGTLWLWGGNGQGALGTNTRTDAASPVQTVAGGTNWRQVAIGYQCTIATKTDGTLWVWGNNTSGQLGLNDLNSRSSPVQTISGGTNWSNPFIGFVYSGQSNMGASRDNSPITVSNITSSTNFSINGQPFESNYVPASAFTQGNAWAWGWASSGQLGTNNLNDSSSPVLTVDTGGNWIQISYANTNSTSGNHGAGVKSDGSLWLWGRNDLGQLGNNSITATSSPVQTVSGGTNWKQVTTGTTTTNSSSAAIKIDGSLWVWGANNLGQLGTNNTTPRSSPVQTISGGYNWKQVNMGYGGTTAAIKNDGSLWMWGNNANGQLGTNNTTSTSSPVQTVSGGTNWLKISAGIISAGIKTDGTLWVWGNNANGGLGTNNTTSYSSPVQTIAGGTNWKDLSTSSTAMAAIKIDGTLWTWGNNSSGQLGDNTTTSKSSPVQTVAGGTNWSSISMSEVGAGAIKTDGTVWTWGVNNRGQLGLGDTTNRSSPVQVTLSSMSNAKSISASSNSMLAIKLI